MPRQQNFAVERLAAFYIPVQFIQTLELESKEDQLVVCTLLIFREIIRILVFIIYNESFIFAQFLTGSIYC
mgnify:CR=1 FL=1